MTEWPHIQKNINLQLTNASQLISKSSVSLVGENFLISSQEVHQLSNDFLNTKLKSFFKNFGTDVIYAFEIIGGDKDIEKIAKAFTLAKEEKKGGYAYSKNNKRISHVMYVGASKAENLLSRMQRHFGIASKGVYSMHIKQWLPSDLECKIQVSVYKVNFPKNNVCTINVLELIEQGLWDQLNPMFGKKSGQL